MSVCVRAHAFVSELQETDQKTGSALAVVTDTYTRTHTRISQSAALCLHFHPDMMMMVTVVAPPCGHSFKLLCSSSLPGPFRHPGDQLQRGSRGPVQPLPSIGKSCD